MTFALWAPVAWVRGDGRNAIFPRPSPQANFRLLQTAEVERLRCCSFSPLGPATLASWLSDLRLDASGLAGGSSLEHRLTANGCFALDGSTCARAPHILLGCVCYGCGRHDENCYRHAGLAVSGYRKNVPAGAGRLQNAYDWAETASVM